MQRTGLAALSSGLRAGEVSATGGGAGALLAALRRTLGGAGAVAPVPPLSRGSTQDAAVEHPHHQYADSHRPGDASTTYQAVLTRPMQAKGQPVWERYNSRPQGPAPHDLAEVAAAYGVADGTAFEAAVQKLAVERQHGLVEHTAEVAQFLQSQGLGLPTVGRMLQHCPALFSFPSEERVEVLLAELTGENCGRSVEEAAELFISCPSLASTRHVMPSIARVVHDQHI